MLKAAESETDYLTPEGTEMQAPIDNNLGGWSTPKNNHVNMFDEDNDHFWSAKYAVCNPMMYDTAATTTSTSTSSSVNYHFRVPFLSLVGGSKIKKLLLLPSNATNYQAEACAYFVLENAIEVPVYSANFTVIIDWTLNFTNNHPTSEGGQNL
jgi:hypothetical protein